MRCVYHNCKYFILASYYDVTYNKYFLSNSAFRCLTQKHIKYVCHAKNHRQHTGHAQQATVVCHVKLKWTSSWIGDIVKLQLLITCSGSSL